MDFIRLVFQVLDNDLRTTFVFQVLDRIDVWSINFWYKSTPTQNAGQWHFCPIFLLWFLLKI